jgi:hypothetical protein
MSSTQAFIGQLSPDVLCRTEMDGYIPGLAVTCLPESRWEGTRCISGRPLFTASLICKLNNGIFCVRFVALSTFSAKCQCVKGLPFSESAILSTGQDFGKSLAANA